MRLYLIPGIFLLRVAVAMLRPILRILILTTVVVLILRPTMILLLVVS